MIEYGLFRYHEPEESQQMKKETVYHINTSSLEMLLVSLNEIRANEGDATIRDIDFSQDVEQGTMTRTVYTSLSITLEVE